MIQEIQAEKKLAIILFIDIKKVFNYILKKQLITQIIKLEVDGNLMKQTKSFLTNQTVQLVIDGYENQKRKIEIKTFYSFPVSYIFFLIYISKVFYKIQDITLSITSLSFIDDLGFIVLGSSIKEIKKVLEEVAKKVLQWGTLNTMMYDITEIEAVLFSKSHCQ